VAFVREMMESGDPFRFRRPKFFKRFKGIGRIARPFVRFVPGVGPVLDQVMGDPYDDDEQGDDDFEMSRGYGWDMGDPGRRQRGAPSRAGDAKKRSPKGRSSAKPKRKGPKGPGFGAGALDFAKGLGSAALQQAGPIAQYLAQQSGAAGALGIGGAEDAVPSIPGALPTMLPDGSVGLVPHGRKGRGARMPHMAHRHVDTWMVKGTRSMNALNPKALRHAARRAEGFMHAVKRIEKAFPALRHAPHVGGGGHRRRGHKAGCGCVTCRRK